MGYYCYLMILPVMILSDNNVLLDLRREYSGYGRSQNRISCLKGKKYQGLWLLFVALLEPCQSLE